MSFNTRTEELLTTLVSFDTTSACSNLELIDFVEGMLREVGIASRITFNAARTKANLFATLRGGDETERPCGLVLSGHTDVVSVRGQTWSSDPFTLSERDGRLYGRGSCDMKGFIASALALVPEVAKSAGKPVYLALSYDEEVGCLGVPALLADLAQSGIRPAGCVIGEPTGMQPVLAHKGTLAYRCCVRGSEMHGSLAPRGVNAVENAARIVTRLAQLGEDLAQTGPYDAGYDVPHATVQTGTIQGGQAINIVAGQCEFGFELRHLPGSNPRALLAEVMSYAQTELLPRMRERHAPASIDFKLLAEIPASELSQNHALAMEVIAALSPSARVGYMGIGSEAGLFQRAGIPSLLCGPGSILQAHQPDEFVECSQLAACDAFLRNLCLEPP